MAFGFLGKLFKKRSSSQPQLNSGAQSRNKAGSNKNQNLNSSTPNLPSQNATSTNLKQANQPPSQSNLKSFGELMPNVIDTDDEVNTNFSPRSKSLSRYEKKSETENLNNSSSLLDTSKKSSAGYESSSSSSSRRSSTNKDLDFLDTLTSANFNETNKKVNVVGSLNPNELNDDKSITTISAPKLSLAEQIKEKQNLKKSGSATQETLEKNQTLGSTGGRTGQSVTFRDPETKEILLNPRSQEYIPNDTIQKLADSLIVDKSGLQDLRKENKMLREKVESLSVNIRDIEAKHKRDNDELIIKLHDTLANDMRTESEKQALAKQLLSKQQESNEKLINEQAKIIESLNYKCRRLETELNKANQDNDANLQKLQIRNLNEEVVDLKNLVNRLNIELAEYQSKYPNLQKSKSTQGKSSSQPVDTKQLMPLISAYDEKITEKDEKLRLMKVKVDDLTNKFKQILEENNELHTKFDTLPDNSSNQMNQMRNLAQLVLEENKVLKDHLEMEEQKLLEVKKSHIQEIGRLSRRIVISESERVGLQNQIDIYKSSTEEVLRKHNDLSVEFQKRIDLQDHLNQVGDLKRKIEELNLKHKQEYESLTLLHQASQNELKDLKIKLSDTMAETKKLKAQNKVLEKAVEEGIGRKSQQKLQEMQKKLEIAELKEKNAMVCIDKFSKLHQKTKVEKEFMDNLVKNSEMELKMRENRLAEENMKMSRLEERFEEYKEKAASKLAKAIEKLQKKDAEFVLIKIEYEKKTKELLKQLQKKQDQIDHYLREKKSIESELDSAWHKTTSENKKLKQVLMEFKTKPDDLIDNVISNN